MAVFKSLHFGESIKDLRGVIRYNSVEKKGFNSEINPRLIGVHSNIGVCENVNDQSDYNNLMSDFILSVRANSNLSNNKRQKYLYEHSIISFDVADDEKLGMEKLTELALKIANEANPDNAPMVLWPQTDNDHGLHFHLVRGMHNENGVYQKKKNDFINVNKFIQKLEVDENLTLTGKNNPDNYIWKTLKNGKKKKTYFPQGNDNSKISKNKNIDHQIKIDEKGNVEYVKKLNKEIERHSNKLNHVDNKITKIKEIKANHVSAIDEKIKTLEEPIEYGFLENMRNIFTTHKEVDIANNEVEIKNQKSKKNTIVKKANDLMKKDFIFGRKIKISLDKKVETKDKTNEEIKNDDDELEKQKAKTQEFTDFRDLINDAYRSSKNAESFLKTLNDNNIEACITYRKKNGGISFNSLNSDISMAGGKVNSYLTFGKIKKNDPELFALLTGETGFGEITLTNDNDINNNLNIEKLNKNYKQKINNDGSTSIFYSKKDAEKYPHNHNLKINADKNKISFGQFSNDHDLKLAYHLAKNENWTNAKSDNKELIKKSMAIAYAENKDDLFFFSTKEPTLKLSELKEIIGDDLLSKDNLIKVIDNNLIAPEDKKEALVFVKQELNKHKEDMTIINSLLKEGHSLKKCVEASSNKIEEQKEKIKAEVIRKADDKKVNQKITQEIEPKTKSKRRSGSRLT